MITDNDLRFDEDSKRYYLTESYVFNKLGTDIDKVAYDELDSNPATYKRRVIEWACDSLYDFIELKAVDGESAKYLVTANEQMHNALKKALGYQLLHFIQYGEDDEKRYSKRAEQVLIASGIMHTIKRQIPQEW